MAGNLVYREMIRRAHEMLGYAYAPFSNFCVGATLLCEDGTFVSGCNVESSTPSIGVCAERCALAKAVSSGYRRFKAIAVVAATTSNCWPCGPCRQLLSEFGPDMDVVVENQQHELIAVKLRDILPSLEQL